MSGRWIMVLAVAALTGCGSEQGLSSQAADAMHKDVADARAAQQAGDPQAAVAALEDLETRIGAADLSPEVAAALKRGAARARRRAAQEIAPPQPAATAAPTPSPTPVPPPEPHGKGKGKAKGHDKQDGQGGDE